MLKNKLFAGILGLIAAVGFAGTVSAFTFDSAIDTPAEKVALQTVLNAVVTPSPMLATDGAVGAKTIAAVKVFQAAKLLKADGITGPMTRAALNAAQAGGSTATFPAGCVSAAGFSTTTGLACTTAAATFPAGCVSALGFSPTTGASCAGTAGGSTGGALTGGEGSLTLTETSKDVEDNAVESKDDVKILAFKAKADSSDINLSSIKLTLKNINYDVSNSTVDESGDIDSSEKLSDYVDSITVYMDSTKVGSMDASDFTKTSDSPDKYSKSIALTNAVIKEGKTVTFYVAVSSGSIDSDNLDAKWNVEVTGGRYVDATGAIMAPEENPSATFGYDNASVDDLLTIKSSSANPAATTIKVDASDTTKDKLIGAFKLTTGTDSSDITVNEFNVALAVTGDTATDIEDVINDVYVTIDGGSEIPADIVGTSRDIAGTFDENYNVDLSNEDIVIAGDDSVEVKIYASFAKQSGNYASGTTVVASVVKTSIDAEGSETLKGTELAGSFTGKVQTLSVAGISIAKTGTATAKYSLSDDNTQAVYTLPIKVTNDSDTDVYIPFGAIEGASLAAAGDNAEGLAFALETSAGAIQSFGADASVSVEADDASIEGDHAFFIEANSSETLVVTVTLANSGTPGTYRLNVTDAQYVDMDATGDDSSAIAAKVSQDFANVRTGLLYVGSTPR